MIRSCAGGFEWLLAILPYLFFPSRSKVLEDGRAGAVEVTNKDFESGELGEEEGTMVAVVA
jgi:hypothetical protein